MRKLATYDGGFFSFVPSQGLRKFRDDTDDSFLAIKAEIHRGKLENLN